MEFSVMLFVPLRERVNDSSPQGLDSLLSPEPRSFWPGAMYQHRVLVSDRNLLAGLSVFLS